MKKIGILLAILLVAGVCAMADEAAPAAQDAVLFAYVDAVALSQAEMEGVDGGQQHGDTFEDGYPNGYKVSRGNDSIKEGKTLNRMKKVLKFGALVAVGGGFGGARGAVAAAASWFIDKW